MGTGRQESRLHARGVTNSRSGAPAPAGRLNLGAMQHLTGFLIAMVDAPARRVYQRYIGKPFELREVELTLLVLLQ